MNVIYPGSFDPVTNGHINIARRSGNICKKVIVAVLDNPHKAPMFTISERVAMLEDVFRQDENIHVETFSGLLIDYASKKGINAIIRGVRGHADMISEVPYAVWNNQLSGGGIETLYLPASPSFAHISSSIVREVAAHLYKDGLDDRILASSVPPVVLSALRKKLEI